MKKLLNILLSAALATTVAGCSFLDVTPPGNEKDDKMFEDVQGYRDAMYGVYASMARTGLYGARLSYELPEILAQMFYNPDIFTNNWIVKASDYEYKDASVRPLIDQIWGDMYETISYVNNILKHIEDKNLASDPDFPLIKGEALALRAFMHFDLMRYFCENIQKNPSAGGIPYAYSFDLKNKKLYTLKECYDNVLTDLDEAEKLLKGDTDFDQPPTSSVRPYLQTRYTHANLQAVHAIKARVYHTMGEPDKAAEYAKKVIESGEFSLITKPDTELAQVKKFPGEAAGYKNSELVWGLYNDRLYDVIYTLFLPNWRNSGTTQIVPRVNVESFIYERPWSGSNIDYRYMEFIIEAGVDQSETPKFKRLLAVDAKSATDVAEQKANTLGICLLRLPEMYYIAAECTYAKNAAEAMEYLETVRRSRGLLDPLEINSFDELYSELLKERRKEMLGEGQIFPEYKRRHANMNSFQGTHENPGAVIPASNAVFVLPWPEKELEFGASNK